MERRSTPVTIPTHPHTSPNAHFSWVLALLASPRCRYCRCRALGLLFGVTLVTATAGGGLSAMVADLPNLVTPGTVIAVVNSASW